MANDKMLFDAVDYGKRTFVRVNARTIIDEMPKDNSAESWLAAFLYDMLTTYQGGLEKMTKAYQDIAMDSVKLAAVPPIVIQRSK